MPMYVQSSKSSALTLSQHILAQRLPGYTQRYKRRPQEVVNHCRDVKSIDDARESETLASNHIENETSIKINEDDDELPLPTTPTLKLNVGGSTFVLRTTNLVKRTKQSYLANFARLQHEQRVNKCDEWLEETQEYFFERSSRLFETIYKFYATGQLHRPLDVCLQEFCDELTYWEIPETLLSSCCAPKILQKDEENEIDLFENLPGAEWRRKIWSITEGDGTLVSNIFSFTSIGFVIISITCLIIGSVQACQVPVMREKDVPQTWQEYLGENFTEEILLNRSSPPMKHVRKVVMEPHPIFDEIEFVCIMWFTFEYILRICIAPKKFAFVRETLNIVDLAAIVPFYLEVTLDFIGIDTQKLEDLKGALLVIRILRVLRVVRILKLGRYSAGMRTFALTLKSSAKQLGMMAMVFATGIIFFSTMVYFMEKDEEGTPFTSIPAGFWWCIVTMTTVGYGDVVPITTIGKLIGSAAIMCGVLVLALPITIIVDNFMKVSGYSQLSID